MAGSCFWVAIDKALGRGQNPEALLDWFRSVNRIPNRVTINGEFLTRRQRQENYKWIDEYKLEDGHLTGSADAFFVLLCEVERCNIVHNSAHGRIVYTSTAINAGPTYVFRSNAGHIDFIQTLD